MATKTKDDVSVYRVPPYHYLHVLDQNTNITRLELGPRTYIRQDHERVVLGPEKMITIPSNHYCIIQNPIVVDVEGAAQLDKMGQVKLRHSDLDVRLSQEPFPLYPGESINTNVTVLRVVPANAALKLIAELNFTDEENVVHVAGDEWLYEGPKTYIPKKEVLIVEMIRASVIKPNQALRIRARKDCVDRRGIQRVTGEEWIIKEVGAYLPGVFEEVVDTVTAYVLTEKKALHVLCLKTFNDCFGKARKNGEEWLITMDDAETHIPSVYEEVVGVINITSLTSLQYCVIMDPCDAKGRPCLGQKKLVRGEKSFFLRPGETLENDIEDVYILTENQGIILECNEEFKDDMASGTVRRPGDLWMIKGPAEYVPPCEVTVTKKRKAIPMDENEGIYVRDIKSGKVRAVTGITYMLSEDEELWEKKLPPLVEELLNDARDPLAARSDRFLTKATKGEQSDSSSRRDKTHVVTFRVPHNAAVQIYDYKAKKSRVLFGPDLAMLAPDEQFTQLSLSGGKPKKVNVIKSLCLLLGPDFMTDIITVETADHARLSLQLSYNWMFEVDQKATLIETSKIFNVPDFVGDACKAIASRVRAAVASVQFDDFHKNSARIIRTSVFGLDESKKVRSVFKFPQNNLIITSIDIQSVEPVDQRTRDSLMKSVQLAIEITTNSQEATARHEAERLEQEARGRLERQKINDEAEAEKSRCQLLELQALSEAVASTGQAKAEAQSRAEAAKIEGEAAVDQARLKMMAADIEADSELARLQRAREAELNYFKSKNDLQLDKNKQSSEIEIHRYAEIIKSLGADTVKAIATAGPELEVKLLQALNLRSTLITDSKQPINLFTTAQGLIGRRSLGLGADHLAVDDENSSADS